MTPSRPAEVRDFRRRRWRELGRVAQSIVADWSPATRFVRNHYVEQAEAMTGGREMPAMNTYVVVFTNAAGGQAVNVTEFRDDTSIVSDARHVIDAEWPSVAIGLGNHEEDAQWLGAWDWNGGAPTWTPDEEG